MSNFNQNQVGDYQNFQNYQNNSNNQVSQYPPNQPKYPLLSQDDDNDLPTEQLIYSQNQSQNNN